jgi:hypothetical protein
MVISLQRGRRLFSLTNEASVFMTSINEGYTADTYWIAAVSAESAASFTL